jgi:thiol-disulfide isomerase/thioredoxin
MKKLTLLVMAVATLCAYGQAAPQKKTSGYAIEITVIGVNPNDPIHLNRYAEAESQFVDSLRLNANNKATFTGTQKLAAGMYNISLPNTANVVVDFFISDKAPQTFSLSFDTSAGMQSMVIEGSPENNAFADYIRFMVGLRQRGQALQERMQKNQHNADSSAFINEQMQALNASLKSKWAEIGAAHKGSTLDLFFKSLQEPEAPEPNISPLVANRDSAMQAYYMNFYTEHFFDNIDFSDARILNMPLLNNSLKTYFTRVLPLDAEILTAQADFVVNKAKANRTVYEFVVKNCYELFRTIPYAELEPIAIYIAEQHAVNDEANWIDKNFVDRMKTAVRLAKLNPEGSIATNLKLQNITGQYEALHDIQARYTVLYFFNPGCGTCAMVTPILWETYKQYRDKGLQVFAVYVDRNREEWQPYIDKNQYHGWINVWDPDGSEGIYEKYDVHAIPTIYLLDAEKKIILQNTTIDGLKNVLKALFQM